jgi:hypothetical protein
VIALRDSLPLLRQGENEICSIRHDWLCSCLYRAAEKAGYSRWWLAEHVAATVVCYLSRTYEKNVITEKQLREIILAALQVIGYAEVALRLDAVAPPFELSLSQLAEEAGPGYELAFFQLLQDRIQPALSESASNISISGLQSCVRQLQSAKTWSRECSRLRSEIVNFLRGHLQRADLKNEIFLTIR